MNQKTTIIKPLNQNRMKEYLKKSWLGWLFWMTPVIIYYFING